MSIIHLSVLRDDEPSAADLAAIEQELPLIEAERDLLDAEIAFINAGENVSALDRRRIRRAEHRVQVIAGALGFREVWSEVVA